MTDPFPSWLREFDEGGWPPAEGECLACYACRDLGYDSPCVSLEGPCGWRYYEALERDYPGGTELIARSRRADAYLRFRQARLAWLGEDHPHYLAEFISGLDAAEAIRSGRDRIGS